MDEVSHRNTCWGCFEKQQKIDELEQEVGRLRAMLKYRQEEGYFGSSTPSSKVAVKANSIQQNREKKGGARPGHKGCGRSSIREESADRVEEVALGDRCPNCGDLLIDKGVSTRTVTDIHPIRAQKVLYRLQHKYCQRCQKKYRAKPASVLPRYLYSNRLIAEVAVMHFVYGIAMGRITVMIGIDCNHLYSSFHSLANQLQPVMQRLIQIYRKARVKHADETGWRIDGTHGYAWFCSTQEISIFLLRHTRSSSVVREIFSEQAQPGVLVVDRYPGYNRSPCQIQYCYAHLLRDVQDLDKQFTDEPEVSSFVETSAPLLAKAMKLRSQNISDTIYDHRAKRLKQKIISVMQRPAQHPGIRHVQDIFRNNPQRMYHWASDRSVPADNNFSERGLRPTVIARKVSFGSGSDRGARTREILMTVLHTLTKQTSDTSNYFKNVLDQLITDPKRDPFALLFPKLDSS